MLSLTRERASALGGVGWGTIDARDGALWTASSATLDVQGLPLVSGLGEAPWVNPAGGVALGWSVAGGR